MADKNIDFDKSLKELEKIVERLEDGNCPLEESIELFEKGMKLSNNCRISLENARQKIINLSDAEKENEDNG